MTKQERECLGISREAWKLFDDRQRYSERELWLREQRLEKRFRKLEAEMDKEAKKKKKRSA